jgi:hypothetical protein
MADIVKTTSTMIIWRPSEADESIALAPPALAGPARSASEGGIWRQDGLANLSHGPLSAKSLDFHHRA